MPYQPMDLKHHDRHELDRESLERESVAYLFQLPEDGIAGYLYTWVDGESQAGSALFLYGPAVGDEPIEVLLTKTPVPYELGFEDWTVGGLHLQVHDDRSADVTFRSDVANVDYHFEPAHPAYAYSCHPDGSPTFIADDRYEQAGRIHGVIRFGDTTIPFDGMGHRDHSWGTRHWGIAQHWKWFESQAGPDWSVHFMELHAMGNRLLRGYVWRDGAMAEVAAADIRYEFDEGFFHHSFEADVTDELGRVTNVKGTVFARYTMTPHPFSHNHEGSVALEIEGVPGNGHLEMQWQKPYVDYILEQDYMKAQATPAPVAR